MKGAHGTMVGFAKEKDDLYLISDPPIRKKTQYVDRIDDIQCNSLTDRKSVV